MPEQNFLNTLATTPVTGGFAGNTVKLPAFTGATGINNTLTRLSSIGATIGATRSRFTSGASQILGTDFKNRVSASGVEQDWRVRISLPDNFVGYDGVQGNNYSGNPILSPLSTTAGVIFPYTPQVFSSHDATYNSQQHAHSNYDFQSYMRTSTPTIQITGGEFTAQNETEASYILAVIHFFRTVTKMFYGQDSNRGTPPPILRLNGYGDKLFSNVPVVITSATFDLPADVDYIPVSLIGYSTATGVAGLGGADIVSVGTSIADNKTRVPMALTVTLTLVPTYSREAVSQFSLNKFVKGELLEKGFI